MGARKIEKYLTVQFEKQVAQDAVEREQKYRVPRVEAIRRKLVKFGARKKLDGYERNELFDMDGMLRKQGRKLRLRRHGKNHAVLTLKGPRLAGAHKTRMEVETHVDYQGAKRILELLNFRVCETYSKMREEYRLNSCVVCLDHIPECGWFVEIEGAPKDIVQTARLLGLRHSHREHRSYRKLIKDHSRTSLAA